MNDNRIVTIGGKPLSDDEAQAIAAKRFPPTRKLEPAPAAEPEDFREADKEASLSMLRNARNLVENDLLEGLIIIGRQKGGGVFFTDLALDRRIVTHNDLFAYVGVLDVMKRELGDIATMAPCMLDDGSIVDPHAEPEELAAE